MTFHSLITVVFSALCWFWLSLLRLCSSLGFFFSPFFPFYFDPSSNPSLKRKETWGKCSDSLIFAVSFSPMEAEGSTPPSAASGPRMRSTQLRRPRNAGIRNAPAAAPRASLRDRSHGDLFLLPLPCPPSTPWMSSLHSCERQRHGRRAFTLQRPLDRRVRGNVSKRTRTGREVLFFIVGVTACNTADQVVWVHVPAASFGGDLEGPAADR